jgi:hypothetical protein
MYMYYDRCMSGSGRRRWEKPETTGQGADPGRQLRPPYTVPAACSPARLRGKKILAPSDLVNKFRPNILASSELIHFGRSICMQLQLRQKHLHRISEAGQAPQIFRVLN